MERTIEASETAEIPSGTVTFLFTDIEGSTRLLEQLREQYALVLESQRQILRTAFARWNGHEIDTQGDSFFVVFPRAIDALCCAVEAQKGLAEHAWPEGVRVRVRMGLHTGEPIMVGGGEAGLPPNQEISGGSRPYLVGMDVHRAARVAAAGYGGQVLLSQTTRDLVYMDMPARTCLRDLGSYKLKDIRFPQQIYQLEIEGLPAEFPALKTLSAKEEPPTPGDPPYRGLQFFDEADAVWFFGRQKTVERLTEAIQQQRFLAVIGASGSGKSSVVRAGLVPAIKRLGTLERVFVLTPSLRPLEALAVSLTRQLTSVAAVGFLIDDLTQDPRSLHLFLQKMLPASTAAQGRRILLVIDQFEELFTQCRLASERQVFVDNLLYAVEAENSLMSLVIVLRADFYQHLAKYDGLRQLVAKHQEYLGAMGPDELRQAIEEPAQRGGWEFSPGLVDLMLHDVGSEPGALPLLSHALLETWNHRRGNTLVLRSYFEAGGVRGAIARTAERVYNQELSPEQKPIARGIFLRLTELGEGTQETRRRVALTELIPPEEEAPQDSSATRQILNTLADARLVTTSEETAEVSHEALIREWGRLQDWLNEDREGLRLQRRLTEAALEWERTQREPGGLYRGARLAQAQEWAAAHPELLNALEREFVQASQELVEGEAAEREAQRQRELEAARSLAETRALAAQRLRRRAVYLSLAVVIALGMALAAIVFGQQANRNARQAGQNLSAAQAASTRAVAQEAAAQAASLLSQAQKATAQSASTQAVGEANLRATSEAEAVQQAAKAESRALAAAAIENLQIDQQRSLLLALQAYKESNTKEAVNALHQSIQASRLRAELPGLDAVGVAVSPDGKQFATLGQEGINKGEVKIWRMGDSLAEIGPTPLITMTNPIDYSVADEAFGYTIAYSPDGSLLATVGTRNTANIWDARNGELLHTLKGHAGNIYGVFFSPDGQRLATASADKTGKIWDVRTGQEQFTLTGHTKAVYAAVISPDGGYLLTGSADQTVIFWDVRGMEAGGQPRAFFTLSLEGNGPVGGIAFSPDGKRLVISTWTTVWVYALDFSQAVPAKLLTTLLGHQNVINGVVFAADGKNLVTGAADSTARVWYASDGKEKFALVGHAGVVFSIALSPDGQHLLSAAKTVQIWDISLSGNQEWFAMPGSKEIRFSPDGKRLLSMDVSYSIDAWWKKLQFWERSPEGLMEKGSIQIDTDDVLQGAVPDRDLNHYITVGAKAGEGLMARVWDIASGQEIFHFPLTKVFTDTLEGRLDSLAISPDGGKLATGVYGRMNGGKDAEGLVVLWDLHTGVPLHILEEHPEGIHIYSVAFSPDGARVATGCDDGKARIFDASNGQLLQTLSGHQRAVMGVDFNQDGTRLVTGSWDGTVIVWDTDTGYKLHPPMKVCPDWVLKANFNPDGSKIAASCLDQKVHLVDTSTGKEWLTLPGEITGFSPDGKYLWSYTQTEGTRGFYLDVNELIVLANKRLLRTWTLDECQTYLDTQTCPPAP